MATKISDMTAQTAPQPGDLLEIEEVAVAASKKSTLKQVVDNGITREVSVQLFPANFTVTTGDGAAYLGPVPSTLNGFNLVSVQAQVLVASTSGIPTIQIARGRQASSSSAPSFADMLTTKLTIDQDEYNSGDAATAAVIDTSNDDIATGDIFRFDVDVAGTGATGLWVTLGLSK